MPEVKFGSKDEPSVRFEMSPEMIAVRTRSTRPVLEGNVPSRAAAELDDAQLVLAFPEAGVAVYRVPAGSGGRSIEARKEALREIPDVRFAGGVLVDVQSGEPVVYTENLFVKFVDAADPDDCREVIREFGLTVKEQVAYATNAFFAKAPEGIGQRIFDIALALLARPDVEYCHPEVIRKRQTKTIAAQQWHLFTTTINNVLIAASANVQAAHALTTGAGVTIAIVDDGVDVDHPEFASAAKIASPRDVTMASNDPRPKDPFPGDPENHGTACAGVACADGSGGASGVAPAARLMPIRLASSLGSQHEADAFQWAADHGADVISCSWGPRDGAWFNPDDPLHTAVTPIPASTRLAIDYASTTGRGGKGCVILFAAGNGNESVDNDGYASYPRVIAVAACNDRGARSIYSDFGKAVWCAFPSNDVAFPAANHPAPLTSGIWTTDRRGAQGYNPGDAQLGDSAGNYTNRFGGTSSACPGAAGVAALVLAANPALTATEVREVLRRASDKIDSEGGNYVDGRSPFYGFGRLNAATAVQLAQPVPQSGITVIRTFDEPLPDLQAVEVAVDVTATETVATVKVHLDIRHTYIGDLVVTLVPPSSTGAGPIVLHDRSGASTANIVRVIDAQAVPGLDAVTGRAAQGAWTLRVEDREARDEGTLRSFGVELTFAPRSDRPGRGRTQPESSAMHA